ncbi:hypothetical protein BDV30DRAFT_234605 [Aspergillus minisclerotigenes]|uniref:Uncharacterized protein n=1 Tax=Aspergillus minisclerotigenes TaxID=656917 RepID=A0A5N6JHG5_9EURO|nr:hypothetical protein BDV30DRAFT_234605 [Aspergillus minisclerotigenes]
MASYAVFNAVPRHGSTEADLAELQADYVESIRHVLERAKKGEYELTSIDLPGQGGSGDPNKHCFQLCQDEQNKQESVLKSVQYKLDIENEWLSRLNEMSESGVLTWLEELEGKVPKHQQAWLRLLKELDENEWQELHPYLERVVGLLSLASGVSYKPSS